jgi:hypothetical protein
MLLQIIGRSEQKTTIESIENRGERLFDQLVDINSENSKQMAKFSFNRQKATFDPKHAKFECEKNETNHHSAVASDILLKLIGVILSQLLNIVNQAC